MKRTRSEVDSAPDEVRPSPPPSANTFAPDLVLIQGTAYNSWDVLVPDMQREVVNHLDIVTRQRLAMTSKKEHKAWDNPDLKGKPAQVVELLLCSTPAVHLKAYMRRQESNRSLYQAYLTSAARLTRPDLCDILGMIIDLFFYNADAQMIIDDSFIPILLEGLASSDNIDAFHWMSRQPWYTRARVFPETHIDIRMKIVASYGAIKTTNYFLQTIYSYAGNTRYLSCIKCNLSRADYPPYDWQALFSSTQQWRDWFEWWKTDERDGLTQSVVSWVKNVWSYPNVIAWVGGLATVWQQLNNEDRVEIREKTTKDIGRVYEHALTSCAIQAVDKLVEMGFAKPKMEAKFFFDNVFGAITEKTAVADWLWKNNIVQFEVDSPNDRKVIVNRIVCFIEHKPEPVISKTIAWIQSHPFVNSDIVVDLMYNIAVLMKKVDTPRTPIPPGIRTIKLRRMREDNSESDSSDDDSYDPSDSDD